MLNYPASMASDSSFAIKRRPFPDDEVLAAPQAKRLRFSITPVFGQTPQEATAIQEAFALIEQHLTGDYAWVVPQLQAMIDGGLSCEEVLAEISALHFFIETQDLHRGGSASFSARLESKITFFLNITKTTHKAACGAKRKEIPSGRSDYLLKVFAHLLIPDSHGISRQGIAAVRRQLGATEASIYLKQHHRDHILHILKKLEEHKDFFSQTLVCAPQFIKLCCLDLKMANSAFLSQTVIKRWIVKMLLTDILQRNGEGNCYAIASFKFMVFNEFGRFLEVMTTCLQTGFFSIGKTSIDLAALMEMRLIRKKELSFESVLPPHHVPILCEISKVLGFELPRGPNIKEAGDVLHDSYSHAFFCSYHRNLLQRMMLECMHLAGVNGPHPESKRPKIMQAITQAMLGNRAEGAEEVYLHSLMLDHFCLWDCNPGVYGFYKEMLIVDGRSITVGRRPKQAEALLKYGSAFLYIGPFGEMERIISIESLKQIVLDCLKRQGQSVLVTKLELALCDPRMDRAIKRALLPFISVDGFEIEDFGELCYLSQAGGHASEIFDAFGIPFREEKPRAFDTEEYMLAVDRHAQTLPEGARMLLFDATHVTTAHGGHRLIPVDEMTPLFLKKPITIDFATGLINGHLLNPLVRERKTAFLASVVTLGDYLAKDFHLSQRMREDVRHQLIESMQKIWKADLNLRKIYEHLNIVLSPDVKSAIFESLPSKNTEVSEWARLLRKALLRRGRICSTQAIERAIRDAHHLPPVHEVADTNWTDGAARTHVQWELRRSFPLEGGFKFSLYKTSKHTSEKTQRDFTGKPIYLPVV